MPILHAVVLGVVQGLTEFLPVSSSGHLELVPWLFGWDNPDKAFDVALHMGTFVGAIAYFAPDLLRYLRAGLRSIAGRRVGNPDERIAWLLLLSALPAALTGALLDDWIEDHLSEVWLIGVLLIAFGVVLLLADRLPASRRTDGFQPRDALGMGVAQALALAPGVSRSGVTISAARRLGFDRDAAARLSFLMSIPIIAGAGLFKGAELFSDGGIPAGDGPAFVWGMVASAITGWAAVWGTLWLVRNRTFAPFVVYRVLVGLAVLGLVAGGFRS